MRGLMLSLLLLSLCVSAAAATDGDVLYVPKTPEEALAAKRAQYLEGRGIYEGLDSFYDPTKDYSSFEGRITDRDDTKTIFKVHSDNTNTKFLRAGDSMSFHIAHQEEEAPCTGYVRSTEANYFVLYVADMARCYRNDAYFRRGTILLFNSPMLATRVKDASSYRVALIERRKDFYRQLNDINHFIWTYEQQKVLTSAEYDKKILALREAKQKALDSLIDKKKDSYRLQGELMKRLDGLDKDLDFYRIGNEDTSLDRWSRDQNLGLPVGKRPQNYKARTDDEVVEENLGGIKDGSRSALKFE